jgi:hypothetical protein
LSSAVIASALALKLSKAARPAPLKLPSSGSAAAMSCWIWEPRSSLAPWVCWVRLLRVVEPMSNFIPVSPHEWS